MAMQSIVRRDTQESYTGYLQRLAEAEGVEAPDAAALWRMDRKRAKRMSNDEWVNPHNPEAEITRLKDGRFHPGGSGRWHGHSDGQAQWRATNGAPHQGSESQPTENGHRVAIVFTRAPWVRTPEQVSGKPVPYPSPDSRRRAGSPASGEQAGMGQFAQSKTAGIQGVAQEIQRRDPEGVKTRMALTDGARALQILVERTLGITLILDLLHVLEKPWKAADMFHTEGNREAELWVWIAPCESCSAKSVRSSKSFARVSLNAASWEPGARRDSGHGLPIP